MAAPDRPRAGARRIADVALRDLAPPGRARVHWPAPCADPTVAALVVLFSPADDPEHVRHADGAAKQGVGEPVEWLVGELMARLGAVVLTAPATHAAEAHAVVCWAADHAAELGADAARIAVVGDRAGAALAERVAELALTEGWPPLRHVALIWPHDDAAPALDGLGRALTPPQPDRSPR